MVFPDDDVQFQILRQAPPQPPFCVVPAKQNRKRGSNALAPRTPYFMPTLNVNWLRKLVLTPVACEGIEEKVYDLAVMCTTRHGNTLLYWLDGSATRFVHGKPEFVVADPLAVLDAGVVLQVLVGAKSTRAGARSFDARAIAGAGARPEGQARAVPRLRGAQADPGAGAGHHRPDRVPRQLLLRTGERGAGLPPSQLRPRAAVEPRERGQGRR